MLGTSTVDPSAAAKWVTSPPNSSPASTASQYTPQATAPHQLPGTSYPVPVQQQNPIVTHHQNFHPHYQNPTGFPNNYGNIPPAQSLKSLPARSTESNPACHPSTSATCSSAEPQPSTSTAGSSACSEGQMTSSSTVASFSSRRARFTFRLGAKAAQRLKRIANFQPQTLRRIGFASIRVGTDDTISVADAPSPPLPLKEEKIEPLEEMDNKSNRASSAMGTVPPSPAAGPSPQLNQQQGTPASQSAPTPVPCQPGFGGPEMPQGMIPQGAVPLGIPPQGAVSQGPPSLQNRPPGQVVNNNSPLLAGLLSNQQPPPGMQPNQGQPQMNPAAQRSFSPYQYPPQPGMVSHQQVQPMDPQQMQAMHEQRQRMMMHQQALQHQMANQVGGPSPQGAHIQMQPGMPAHPQQVYYNPQQGGPQGPPRVPMNYPPGSMPPGAMPGQPLYHGQPQRMPMSMPPGYPGGPQGPPQGAMAPQFRPQEEAPPPKKKRKPTKKQQQKEAELAAAAAAQNAQQQQQQQMMVGHPQHMGPGGMMGYPPGGHGGYPHGPPQYPPGYPQGATPQQQQMWQHQQMQQRMMFQQQQQQQQQQQAAAAAAGQPGQWPQQRPPVPYPPVNPVMGMENGPASVHPPVSQRTSAEFSQEGTSPATPLQQPAGMSRTDSHPNMFGFISSNPASSNTDTTFDKIWSGDGDGDLGDLDDIEPMNELSCSSSLLTDGALMDNSNDNGIASTSSPEKSTPTPNGDRIDSSITSVLEMVSKSCSQSSQSGPTVSQPITVTASNANPLKRRHSNSQMGVVNMENQNTAPQQQHHHQHQDHRFVQNVPLPQSMPPTHLQQHHMQQLHAQNANTGPGRPKQNGDSRMVNGHEGPPVGKVPNGSRSHTSAKMTNREPPQNSDQIAQLVNSIMKEEKRKKAVEMELKAKNPRKGRRKADMQIKEETQNEDEIFDGRPRNTMAAATANFTQVLARQTVMLQQQHIQPKQ